MKNILITGASKGIGYATALRFAQQGHQVFALARSESKLEKLSKESVPGKIIPIAIDLTSQKEIDILPQKLGTTFSIDILVNNAGALINKPFMDTDMDDWMHQLQVNLLAPVRLIKGIKGYLKKGSHIVNIGSMGGFQGSAKFPGLAAYSASKGALSIFSECLSTEFSEEGISVNCLCLGAVQTEMLNEAFPGYKAPTQPEEMAGFIADFSLNARSYINGKVIPVALNNPG
ncbi:MAG: SDR family oxidoreductase [Balneolaceae bacterium]|nr:SDR family oxidoreductase [Balneolaceae bacterium]MBO6547009.1 SDR family oxidoreductase [Balneolaceae bacterium]MBO6649369.1 SDR family oxidoreductase [Balneolaceae bacterium]